MNSDPIVAEIRNLRERRAARFGFDIGSIVKDGRKNATQPMIVKSLGVRHASQSRVTKAKLRQ